MVVLNQTVVDFIIITLAEHCLVALPVTVGAVSFLYFAVQSSQQATSEAQHIDGVCTMKTLHILFVNTLPLVGTISKEKPQTESIKHKHLGAPFISEFLRTQLSYNTCLHVKWTDLSKQIMMPLVSSKAVKH